MDFEICAQAPKSWQRLTIEDVCTRITSGGTPSRRNSEFFINGTIPWVKTQELQDGWIQETEEKITEEALRSSSAKLLPRNTVMLAMYGATVGQLGILGSSMTCNQACCALIVDKNIADFRYVYYLLRLHREVIKGLATGAAQQNLSAAQIKQFKFAFPDIKTQTRVADALSTLDDKIDLNRRINQTLESMAQAIFKSWFVDFDPVKAKIAAIEQGQDPLRAAMRAISGKTDFELDQMPRNQYKQLATTAALFPDAMEESELGKVPKGWGFRQISQFGKVVCGKTPAKNNPNYFGEGTPFIKIPDMHNNVYVTQPVERLTEQGVASQPRKTIPSGSICVSCIATVGKVVLVHEPSQTNQQINSIIPYSLAYSFYLYFQMLENRQKFVDLASGGSATLNMNTSTFSKVEVLLPNGCVVIGFNELVAPIFSQILANQKQVDSLTTLRDTLLPKLLSGELSVSSVEEMVKA